MIVNENQWESIEFNDFPLQISLEINNLKWKINETQLHAMALNEKSIIIIENQRFSMNYQWESIELDDVPLQVSLNSNDYQWKAIQVVGPILGALF